MSNEVSSTPRPAPVATAVLEHVVRSIVDDPGAVVVDASIAQDASELFNYLTTGFGPGRGYMKLLPGVDDFHHGNYGRRRRLQPTAFHRDSYSGAYSENALSI